MKVIIVWILINWQYAMDYYKKKCIFAQLINKKILLLHIVYR